LLSRQAAFVQKLKIFHLSKLKIVKFSFRNQRQVGDALYRRWGVPTAAVAKVTREDLSKAVHHAQARNSAPYVEVAEVALHAKVSGYVGKMNVDFGDKVKAGQLLATIEVPELQAELDNAQAAESKGRRRITPTPT
jgi:multidrug efflux pump subunit AcrA (membrane-fusion protein)